MEKLLRLKHWQLFVLMFGIPFILQFFFAAALALAPDSMIPYAVMPLIMLLFIIIFFGWFYALGVNMHKRLPASVKMNLGRFKIFLFIPVIYILSICILMFFVFNNISTADQPPRYLGLFALIIPVHLFSMFCIFYCLYFNAKALKSVELQRPVTFNDFVGEFFLLWFYPVGVWFIQPRVNKLVENNNVQEEIK